MHWKESLQNIPEFFKQDYVTETEIKPKNLEMFWLGKGLKKSSKIKQRLYNKFVKNKFAESEETYKKNCIWKPLNKIKLKKYYNASLLNKYKCHTKQTLQVMKKIRGKEK